MSFLVIVGIIACCYYSSKSQETKKEAVRDNSIQVICPHCGGSVNITSDGEWICPHCKKEFTYYENNNNNNNQKSNEPKHNNQSDNGIHVNCPYCKEDVVFQSEGSWVCPYCSKTFIYRGAIAYKSEDACNDSVIFMIILLAKISKADGVVHPEQEKIIQKAVQVFRLSSYDYQEIKSKFIQDLDEYYSVLNCNRGNTNQEIKIRKSRNF